ncbi:MAG TPA: sigma-54 dependent transcriptional regulator [Acidobacteriaceae bacterium]|jgi:two-component system response regulator HydG|nr:sigma-54 dependent transcriptional regulator [Acidobacteriaceae bacterium]
MQAHPQSTTAARRTPLPLAAKSSQLLRVLVIDDDPPVRHACAEIARSLGFLTDTADSFAAGQTALTRGAIDIILLDLKLPGGSGLLLLDEIRSRQPAAIVIIMTAFATVNSAVEAIRVGAGDYLTKPFTLDELSATLERAAQRRSFDTEARCLRDRLRIGRGMGELVGHSPAMEKLYRILSKVAFTTHPVLLLGESGTGKELVARCIHLNGPHASKPFVPVDCGALAPTLIESELFGHVKGAFTGAGRAKTGLLASAPGGTVFLDEIGELPLDLQTKLLRALQEKEVRPVGATHTVPISARILAATNRDLEAMVESGRFRKDLFFRLNVVKLRIPPLRERKKDIPLLTAHILERLGHTNGHGYAFAEDAMHLLMDYDWPGNVRELEHAIERACALTSGPILHLGDFPTQLQNAHAHREWGGDPVFSVSGISAAAASQSATLGSPLPNLAASAAPADPGAVQPIAELEKQAILATLRQLNGDKLMAARLLGIGKTTLYRKLKEYGVSDDEL